MSQGLLNKIKNIRQARGISAHGLARLASINSPIIYAAESGQPLSVKTCWRIIEALKLRFDAVSFAKKIKKRRLGDGLSVPQLARQTNISYRTFYRVEKGEPLSIKTYCKIAKALNIPLEDYIAVETNEKQ